MSKLQLYQQTDVPNPETNRTTVLREGDEIIIYKDGLVRFSREGKRLYGCLGGDDKCFVGNGSTTAIISLLSHFGILLDLVREDKFVSVYRLWQKKWSPPE